MAMGNGPMIAHFLPSLRKVPAKRLCSPQNPSSKFLSLTRGHAPGWRGSAVSVYCVLWDGRPVLMLFVSSGTRQGAEDIYPWRKTTGYLPVLPESGQPSLNGPEISNTFPNAATSFGRCSPLLQYQGLIYEVSERERKMTPVYGLFRRILCFKFLRARLLRLGNSPARMSRRILPSNFPRYLPAMHRWD